MSMWYRENEEVSIAEDCECKQIIKKCDCAAIAKHEQLVKQLEQYFDGVFNNE